MAPQSGKLLIRQLKHEIAGEAFEVSLDGAHQDSGLDVIEFGQVLIEHHLLAANQVDAAGDAFNRDDGAERWAWAIAIVVVVSIAAITGGA